MKKKILSEKKDTIKDQPKAEPNKYNRVIF